MKSRLLCLSVTLAAIGLAGCDRIDPNSPLGKRKAIYQQMLDIRESRTDGSMDGADPD